MQHPYPISTYRRPQDWGQTMSSSWTIKHPTQVSVRTSMQHCPACCNQTSRESLHRSHPISIIDSNVWLNSESTNVCTSCYMQPFKLQRTLLTVAISTAKLIVKVTLQLKGAMSTATASMKQLAPLTWASTRCQVSRICGQPLGTCAAHWRLTLVIQVHMAQVRAFLSLLMLDALIMNRSVMMLCHLDRDKVRIWIITHLGATMSSIMKYATSKVFST